MGAPWGAQGGGAPWRAQGEGPQGPMGLKDPGLKDPIGRSLGWSVGRRSVGRSGAPWGPRSMIYKSYTYIDIYFDININFYVFFVIF